MRDSKWFAAPESDIRDAHRDDLAGKVQSLFAG
jgi:hypothetical protein